MKVTNQTKQKVRTTIFLFMMTKKKQLEKYPTKPKSNKKYFNYRKKTITLGTTTGQTKKNLKIY